MGWFGKKDEVIDLGERYRRQQERAASAEEMVSESSEKPQSAAAEGMGFFGSIADSVSGSTPNVESSSEYVDMAAPAGEKRKKLAKRLMDLTSKNEDLSNQIYHLQQRIELLERKMGVN